MSRSKHHAGEHGFLKPGNPDRTIVIWISCESTGSSRQLCSGRGKSAIVLGERFKTMTTSNALEGRVVFVSPRREPRQWTWSSLCRCGQRRRRITTGLRTTVSITAKEK